MKLARQFAMVLMIGLIPLSGIAAPHCKALPLELKNEYRQGDFLLQYDLTGLHALHNQTDANGNQVPDLVEDVAIQLQTMKRVMDYFGFVNPLKQPRYQSQGARAVLVRFLKMSGNGLAFDEVRHNWHGECVLLINLSSKLGARNLTPAHEWFHLVQYGYTPFKRPWFLEGMARWSEGALRKESGAIGFNASIRNGTLFSQSYEALAYWAQLAADSREKHEHEFPAAVAQARYVNGEQVLQDNILVGPLKMRRALERLAVLGADESAQRGLDPHAWPETMQRLPEHDEAMKRAIDGL